MLWATQLITTYFVRNALISNKGFIEKLVVDTTHFIHLYSTFTSAEQSKPLSGCAVIDKSVASEMFVASLVFAFD